MTKNSRLPPARVWVCCQCGNAWGSWQASCASCLAPWCSGCRLEGTDTGGTTSATLPVATRPAPLHIGPAPNTVTAHAYDTATTILRQIPPGALENDHPVTPRLHVKLEYILQSLAIKVANLSQDEPCAEHLEYSRFLIDHKRCVSPRCYALQN